MSVSATSLRSHDSVELPVHPDDETVQFPTSACWPRRARLTRTSPRSMAPPSAQSRRRRFLTLPFACPFRATSAGKLTQRRTQTSTWNSCGVSAAWPRATASSMSWEWLPALTTKSSRCFQASQSSSLASGLNAPSNRRSRIPMDRLTTQICGATGSFHRRRARGRPYRAQPGMPPRIQRIQVLSATPSRECGSLRCSRRALVPCRRSVYRKGFRRLRSRRIIPRDFVLPRAGAWALASCLHGHSGLSRASSRHSRCQGATDEQRL